MSDTNIMLLDTEFDALNYIILATDYENFSLIWMCIDDYDNEESDEYAWVLARNYIINTEYRNIIDNLIDVFELGRQYFIDVNQDRIECLFGMTPFDTMTPTGYGVGDIPNIRNN